MLSVDQTLTALEADLLKSPLLPGDFLQCRIRCHLTPQTVRAVLRPSASRPRSGTCHSTPPGVTPSRRRSESRWIRQRCIVLSGFCCFLSSPLGVKTFFKSSIFSNILGQLVHPPPDAFGLIVLAVHHCVLVQCIEPHELFFQQLISSHSLQLSPFNRARSISYFAHDFPTIFRLIFDPFFI